MNSSHDQEQKLSQQKANGIAGKFGHLQKDAPAKGLPATPDSDYEQVAEKSIERTRNIWAARIELQSAESTAAAQALAAATRAQYPDAEVIKLKVAQGLPFYEVLEISGPNMGTVPVEDLDDLVWEDEFQDGLASLTTDQGNTVATRYMDIQERPHERTTATLHLSHALTPAPATPGAPSERGRRILEQYQALNDGSESSEEDTVAAMLSDLNEWSRLNGHDLASMLARADH
jgi:hypothetical protein